MIKKYLFGFVTFFIFSVILLLGLSSKSYAWTYDQFIEYMEQIASSTEAPTNFKNTADVILRYKINLENKANLSDTSFVVTNAGGTGWIDIRSITNQVNVTTLDSTGVQFTRVYGKQYRLDRSNGSVATSNSVDLYYLDANNVIGLLNMASNYEEVIPSNIWLQNHYILGFEFTPNNDGVVTYNGYQDVNAIKINFFNGRTLLGHMNKLNADCDYYRYVVLDPNGNRIAWLNYHIGDSYYSSENMEINIKTSNIYVDTRLLYLNNIYTLAIYGSQEKLFDDLSAAKDSQIFTYVPLRQNAVISGGAVTNEGSGDNYTPQNQTNDILNNINDVTDANNTFNNFFSGDTDSFASSIGYSPIQNPFVAIIENTLETIIDIILGSGNETLTLGMHGNSIVLHSEDFVIPDGQIKTFITLVTNGFLIWAIIKYGFQLYQWINTGRLQNLVNEANGHWYKALF